LAAVGVAAALEQLGALQLEPHQYVALGLTVIGIGLIVGTWVGRAYGLIPLGLLLLPILVALSVGPVPIRGGVGEFDHAPRRVGGIQDEYELGLGRMQLDLTRVQFSETPVDIRIAVGVGETTVLLPDEVTAAVDVDLRAGDVDLFGQQSNGPPFAGPLRVTDEGHPDGGRVQLHIENGVGEVTVRRLNEEL
jgi:hypothetical protein